MSGMHVVIQATGLDTIIARIEGFSKRALDLSVPLKQAGIMMLSSIKKNFRAGGRPSPWAPLALSTLKNKNRQGLSHLPLTGRTGLLQNSIVPASDMNRLTLGTSIRYAAIHQYGGMAGRNLSAKIPQRKYLLFQEEDVRRINKLVIEHLLSKNPEDA